MSNELVTKQTQIPATLSGVQDLFSYDEVETKDLKIPKLLLMQAGSKFVKDDDIAKAGDMVNSISGEILGTCREKDLKPIEFTPIYMYKTWVKNEVLPGGQKEYAGTEAVTPENTDLPWEYSEFDEESQTTKSYTRTKNINFYVILKKDFDNPVALPYVLSFRGSSSKAASIITSHFAECKFAKAAGTFRIPMDRTFILSGKIEKNDKGSFYVYSVREGVKTSESVMQQAVNWYKQVAKSDHSKVHTDEVSAESESF